MRLGFRETLRASCDYRCFVGLEDGVRASGLALRSQKVSSEVGHCTHVQVWVLPRFLEHGLMSRPITDGRCWAIGGSKTAEADLESRKESRCSGRSVRRCSQVFRQRCRSMRIRRQGRNRRSLLRPQIPPASYLDN